MPVDMPSLILPKIASGPIAKIKDAVTNPSTKGDSPCASKRLFKRIPRFSSLASIFKVEPRRPPRSSEPSTTMMGQPSGRALERSSFHKALMEDAAPIKVIAPRTSVMRLRVLSARRLPIRMPRAAPPTIATILMTVPAPTNMSESVSHGWCSVRKCAN